MTIKLNAKLIGALLLGALLAAGFSAFAATRELSHVDTTRTEEYAHFIALDAVEVDSNSDGIDVRHARTAEVYFAYNDGSGTATTTFSVEVSPNNSDWYDYNKLISNAANTNGEDLTRVATLQAVGTTSGLYAIDMENDAFGYVRCVAAFASTTVTASDNATCEITVKE